MESEIKNRVDIASIVRTRLQSKKSHVVTIPKWLINYFELDLTEPTYLLFTAAEGDKEVKLRPATVEERMVGLQLDLYLNGLWEYNPTDDEMRIQLELEQMHRLDPPKFITVKNKSYILKWPFSNFSEREVVTYLDLEETTVITHKYLHELGFSRSAAINFIKKCLNLNMLKEIEPIKKPKRGRPIQQYVRSDKYKESKPDGLA